jgi:uncharacterized protein
MMIDIETARGYYGAHDSAHGFDHVLRVWRLAERIGREEGADMLVLQAAALLHDVGRAEEARTGVCHAQASATQAQAILRGHPPERVEAVTQAIAQHRFRGGQRPTSLEGQVLFDADKLDAIGAIGVARAYAIAGAQNQHLWADVSEDYAQRSPQAGRDDLTDAAHTPLHEFHFKLARLKDTLFTATGKRLAEERHRVMVAYFARLAQEVTGEV